MLLHFTTFVSMSFLLLLIQKQYPEVLGMHTYISQLPIFVLRGHSLLYIKTHYPEIGTSTNYYATFYKLKHMFLCLDY